MQSANACFFLCVEERSSRHNATTTPVTHAHTYIPNRQPEGEQNADDDDDDGDENSGSEAEKVVKKETE